MPSSGGGTPAAHPACRTQVAPARDSEQVAPRVTLMDQTAVVASFILKEIDNVLDDLSSEDDIVQHAVMERKE